MAYCRFDQGKSDLYIIGVGGGTYHCLGCKLLPQTKVKYSVGSVEHNLIGQMPTQVSKLPNPFKSSKFLRPKRWRSNRDFNTKIPPIAVMHSVGEVMAHVKKHLVLKHKVPKHVIARLASECKEEQTTTKNRKK